MLRGTTLAALWAGAMALSLSGLSPSAAAAKDAPVGGATGMTRLPIPLSPSAAMRGAPATSTSPADISGARAAVGGLAVEVATPVPIPTEAPFRVLDNVEGHNIDLGLVPYRPMAVTPDHEHLYTVNPHASLLLHFDRSLALQHIMQVPWGPVSVALWNPSPPPESAAAEGDAGELLVVSRGTYALTRVSRQSFEILGVLELPAEPADIIVDADRRAAYIACSGDDSVVVVNLDTFTVEQTIPIDSKHPAFLALDEYGLLVAPQLSGNNTTVDKGHLLLDAGDQDIIDLSEHDLQLPDEDLFRIDLDSFEVEAVSRSAGAVLFDHGVNPATGQHWQLGTEAFNFGPFGEPLLEGNFISNRLIITDLPAPGVGIENDHHFVALDGPDVSEASGALSDSAGPPEAVGQPYALDFSQSGEAFVTGLLTDNVTWFDAFGGFKAQLPTCSIPRGVGVVDVDGAPGILLVYCWGSNEIQGWNVQADEPFVGFSLSLGFDPTPALAKAGRALFFSGAHSERGNASCASCHIEGATDMLAWYLGEPPFDDKGPMVTQTLKGIEGLLPYHWRGERADLEDFNIAFPALLGADELDEEQFKALEAYVFRLQNPANPRQHPRRVVSAELDEIGGLTHLDPNAVNGQDLFFDKGVVGDTSCNGCHTLPTGTDNDIFPDEGGHIAAPKRSHFKVAPFHALWRKEQPTRHTIDVGDGEYDVPTLGVAVSAAGLTNSLLDFVSLDPFDLDEQGIADVTAFVHQHDSGLAPAVHRGFLLAEETAADAGSQLTGYLLPQAQARHCGIAAVGTVQTPSGPGAISYAWHRDDGLFHSDQADAPPITADDLIQRAAGGQVRLAIFGTPVAMAPGLSNDLDGDGLPNLAEFSYGASPFVADSDQDGFWDGAEVDAGSDPDSVDSIPADGAGPTLSGVRVVYATTQVAKIALESDEPATIIASYNTPDGAFGEAVASSDEGTNHTVFLRHLEPGKTYTVSLIAEDQAGNRSRLTLFEAFTTLDVLTPSNVVDEALTLSDIEKSGGDFDATLSAVTRTKAGLTKAGFFLSAEVYVNGEEAGFFFVSTESGDDGLSTLPISLEGLSAGDEIRIVVFSMYTINETNGQAVTTRWSFPDTLPENRELTVIY